VIAAAREYGAHGVGIDINPERIAEAKENAKKAGRGKPGSLRRTIYSMLTFTRLPL
jgi:predicted O-methyltransferase YrrM